MDIINRLGSKPESCDFSNGCGYIQHKKETFLSVRNDLLELAKFYIDHKWIQEAIDRQTVHSSYAHRLIGELSNISLNKAWYRIHCTDSRYREWGQPYYADHPESGTQQEIKG